MERACDIIRRVVKLDAFAKFDNVSNTLIAVADIIEIAEKVERKECGFDEEDLLEEILHFEEHFEVNNGV